MLNNNIFIYDFKEINFFNLNLINFYVYQKVKQPGINIDLGINIH